MKQGGPLLLLLACHLQATNPYKQQQAELWQKEGVTRLHTNQQPEGGDTASLAEQWEGTTLNGKAQLRPKFAEARQWKKTATSKLSKFTLKTQRLLAGPDKYSTTRF